MSPFFFLVFLFVFSYSAFRSLSSPPPPIHFSRLSVSRALTSTSTSFRDFFSRSLAAGPYTSMLIFYATSGEYRDTGLSMTGRSADRRARARVRNDRFSQWRAIIARDSCIDDYLIPRREGGGTKSLPLSSFQSGATVCVKGRIDVNYK